MNSKVGRLFSLTINLILAAFLLLVGLYSLLLPWSFFLQTQIIHLILNETLIFSLFGLGLTLMGVSLIMYTVIQLRRRYIPIRVGHQAITIDQTLVQQYIDHYWQQRLSGQQITSEVAIKKQAIYITTTIPSSPELEPNFIEQTKQELIDLFGRLIGYPHEVFLTIDFQT